MVCKGPDISHLRIFRIKIGILEGPTALLALILAISTLISFSVTGDKNKLSQMGDDINSLAVGKY